MRSVLFTASTALALLLVPLAASSAEHAMLEPRTQGDVTFLSGGVGDAEQRAILTLADGYNLWIALTRPDGAYLAGVDVRIEDAHGVTVLETTTRGPILLVDLPPGRYVVRTAADDRSAERREVDVSEHKQSRIFVAMEELR